MDELLNGMSVPCIVAAVYWTINLIKYTAKNNETFMRFIPMLAAFLGVLYSVVCYFAVPNLLPVDNLLVAIVLGGASGLTATGFNQVIKQINK